MRTVRQIKVTKNVMDWRKRRKAKLVTLFGNKCKDCSITGPPYLFDFDHRNPKTKKFGLSSKGNTLAWNKALREAKKCDMVCANCHRHRTHKQRCKGCDYCRVPV